MQILSRYILVLIALFLGVGFSTAAPLRYASNSVERARHMPENGRHWHTIGGQDIHPRWRHNWLPSSKSRT
ncbi:hypothetical protein CC1G_09233 [Coprinopsis cinerea okayama7|uniref:Uncharacterized protein n=1 Tax=Coprinopsis cinerea (strain Okayama-7 / 130 / ATCC MYA-4618 / FGSC 9003) TaxID=240176 RepID=A8P513_COPC7|nr:hypothetical protein CC1G_09233 [Coprinopsis cinerea okayama7\|eukprot:XP_001838856.2 hypothetical protein CC1G_09233 [Coprinopsis cinerea okayama7\